MMGGGGEEGRVGVVWMEGLMRKRDRAAADGGGGTAGRFIVYFNDVYMIVSQCLYRYSYSCIATYT